VLQNLHISSLSQPKMRPAECRNNYLKKTAIGLQMHCKMSRLNEPLEESGFIAEVSQQVQSPLYYPKDSPLIVTLTRVYSEQIGRNDNAIAI